MSYNLKNTSGGPLSIFDGDKTLILPDDKMIEIENFDSITNAVLNKDLVEVYVKKTRVPMNVSFSLEEGLYRTVQEVSLTCTSGATIRYTLDGSEPSETVGEIYSSSISLTSHTMIRAIAYKEGSLSSQIVSKNYIIALPIPEPIISPAGGTYIEDQVVSISSDATVRYTLDGSEPSRDIGMIYTQSFIVSSNTLVKVVAYDDYSSSMVNSATYIIPMTLSVNGYGLMIKDTESSESNFILKIA